MTAASLEKTLETPPKIDTPFDFFLNLITTEFPDIINREKSRNYPIHEIIPYEFSWRILLTEIKPYGLNVLMPHRNIGIITIKKSGEARDKVKELNSNEYINWLDREFEKLQEVYLLLRNNNYHPVHSRIIRQQKRGFTDPQTLILDYNISVGLDLKDRVRIGF